MNFNSLFDTTLPIQPLTGYLEPLISYPQPLSPTQPTATANEGLYSVTVVYTGLFGDTSTISLDHYGSIDEVLQKIASTPLQPAIAASSDSIDPTTIDSNPIVTTPYVRFTIYIYILTN